MHNSRIALHALLLLFTAIILGGCSEEEGLVDPNKLTADYYIQASFDGSIKTFQSEYKLGGYAQGLGASRWGDSEMGYFTAERSYFAKSRIEDGRLVVEPTNRIEINFIKRFADMPLNEDYGLAIQLGAMPFGDKKKEREGVEVVWVDGNGTSWSSAGEQAGSVFVVDTHIAFLNSALKSRYKTTGTFSCRLYSPTGQQIVVENGKFSLSTIAP